LPKEADCYTWLAYLVQNKGHIQLALDYERKALATYENIVQQKSLDGGTILTEAELYEFRNGVANSLNNIGYIFRNQGDIQRALEYYFESFKIREELNNDEGMGVSLNNIGTVYNIQGETEKALEYYFKSLKIHQLMAESPDELKMVKGKKGLASSMNNIGSIYFLQGDQTKDSVLQRESIQKGLDYFTKSLKIREEIGDKGGMALCFSNLGFIYQSYGDPGCTLSREECLNEGMQKGLDYFFKSLKIMEEIGDKRGVTYSLNNIGGVYLDKGEAALAKEYALKSMTLGKELGFPDDIKDPAKILSTIYKEDGDFKQALVMYELFIQMRDSINNEETQKSTIRQQTKYEFEKAQLVKEQEERERARLHEEETSRRDNLQYSVILLGLLVLGSLILLVRPKGGGLGKLSLSVRLAEGLIFFSFLIFFEFILVLADPYIENWSSGAPGIKLLFNAGIAALIFPLHSLFEAKLKGRLVKSK